MILKRHGHFLILFLFLTLFQSKAQPFLKDVQAFEAQDRIEKPEAGGILFIGSSSFTKWKNVSDWFPDKRIINRGFGGSSLPDLIGYFDKIVTPYNPIQVVVYCGENDVASSPSTTADTVLQRFKILHQIIRKQYPKVRISFVSLKPSPARASFLGTVKSTNAAIQQFCMKSKNTDFIDVFTPMLNTDGSFKEELFVEDRLHMNEKGYLIWQKAIAPFLVKTN